MKKYKVTQEFMDELETWKNMLEANVVSINEFFFDETIKNVENWRSEYVSQADRNQRFGAIVNWINGEDVFETQKTYKYYVARTSSPHLYFSMKKWYHSELPKYDSNCSEKKVFSTREEAEKWVIPDYEVVEIDENEL